MNTPGILALVLTAFIMGAQAQESPNPAPAAEAPQTEMQKWIATTDAQWQAVFKRDVADVHEAELNKVKLVYLTTLEEGIVKTSKASDLKGAVALRDEQKRFGDTQLFPAEDDDADAAVVKHIRAAIRAQLAPLETKNAVRAKALHAKYDAMLAQAQAQLTQRQRLDDALLVQAKREEVATAWLAGIPATPAPVAVAEQSKPQVPARGPRVATMPAAIPPGVNLLKNPNFQNGTEGWACSGSVNTGRMAIDPKELHKGKSSLRIDNPEANRTLVFQNVTVKPNTRYQLTGYIKTKDVASPNGGNYGAGLIVAGTNERTMGMLNTIGWMRVAHEFTTNDQSQIVIGPCLGHNYGMVTGTAWFSELALTEVGRDAPKK